jgi:hypothetical protein
LNAALNHPLHVLGESLVGNFHDSGALEPDIHLFVRGAHQLKKLEDFPKFSA